MLEHDHEGQHLFSIGDVL